MQALCQKSYQATRKNNYRIAKIFFSVKTFCHRLVCFLTFSPSFFCYKTPLVSFGKFVLFRFSINRKPFTVTLISRFPCTAQALFSSRLGY